MKYFDRFSSSRLLRLAIPLVLLGTTFPLVSCSSGEVTETKETPAPADPDREVAGTPMPAGWSVRPDNGSAGDIAFTIEGDVYHFTMGPAGTFYNPEWTKSGDYSYSARVTQTAQPTHPISYGLMIGGSGLDGPGQTYTYFLTRNQGDFFIANREGGERIIVVDWTPNDALAPQAADGTQTNVLGIQVAGDEVIFTANGTEIRRMPKNMLHTDGMNGFRVGHNLDVDISEIMQ